MEAIDFLKEAQRLCSHYDLCAAGCPLYKKCVFYFRDIDETKEETEKKIEQNAAIIEQWNKENPIVTNVQKFKEVFGVLPTDYVMGRSRETWWDKPYKEPEKGART